jgi:hypothetical protein
MFCHDFCINGKKLAKTNIRFFICPTFKSGLPTLRPHGFYNPACRQARHSLARTNVFNRVDMSNLLVMDVSF